MGCISQDNQKIYENICHPVFIETCIGNITQWWKCEMEVRISTKGNEGQTFQLFVFAMLEVITDFYKAFC